MTIDEALTYIEETSDSDTIFSIAMEALRDLAAIDPAKAISVLDDHTDGHWVQQL